MWSLMEQQALVEKARELDALWQIEQTCCKTRCETFPGAVAQGSSA